MKLSRSTGNLKKGKRYFLLIISIVFLLLFLPSCFILIDITDSPYGYSGRWQGMPLFDQGEDYGKDKPSFIFFVHINQIGGKIFGVLSRVDSYGFSEGPISGEQKDKILNFTAKFHHETLTFEGLWIDDQKAWVGKWSSDLGQKGQVLFEINKTSTDQSKDFFTKGNKLTLKGGFGKPVIFIHGMNSDGSRWNKLLNELEKSGFYDNHQIWIFQYNWSELITVNGLDLYKKINESGIQNPIIIAHSMGGLVARSYIAQGGTIEKLVTFGTPHLGTPLADLGAQLLGSDNFSTWIQESLIPGVADMKESSSFIADLSNNQYDLENRKKYIVFASTMDSQPVKTIVCQDGNCSSKVVLKWQREDYFDNLAIICYRMISGENDGYVSKDSALFKGSTVLPKNQFVVKGFLDHTKMIDPEKCLEIVPFLMTLE